jgi:hypothetical protein
MLSKLIPIFLEKSRKLSASRFQLISGNSSVQTYKVESVNVTFDIELSEARIHSRIYKKFNLADGMWQCLIEAFSSRIDTTSTLEVLFWNDVQLLRLEQVQEHFENVSQIEIASRIFSVHDKSALISTLTDTFNLTELIAISAFENIKQEEGEGYFAIQKKYERSPLLRKIAIQQHGVNCVVCNFNFELAYGTLGKGFIHIHHVERLADTGKKLIDPRTDLVPVCPNCHAMLHSKNPPLKPAELKHQLKGMNND